MKACRFQARVKLAPPYICVALRAGDSSSDDFLSPPPLKNFFFFSSAHTPDRGFLGESADLTFVTDLRSNKVEEIARRPDGEVAWYFPQTREQFRIAGKLKVIGPTVEVKGGASKPDPSLKAPGFEL